jgi:hypothetical protein
MENTSRIIGLGVNKWCTGVRTQTHVLGRQVTFTVTSAARQLPALRSPPRLSPVCTQNDLC